MSITAMSRALRRLSETAKKDGRYKVDAYLFVQQALAFAQFEMGMGRPRPFGVEGEEEDRLSEPPPEAHLTGQQLCEAIRVYAADVYGMLAKAVLNSWGVYTTADFGEIVYKLIEIGEMSKSETDRREDFHDQYDFTEAFERRYQITIAEISD
jgi:uncharacterized repeat protein (TIGR04138 family)